MLDTPEISASSFEVDDDRASIAIPKRKAEHGQLAVHQLLRIPLPGSSLSTPHVFVAYIDELSLIVTCTSQSGQLDLIKLSVTESTQLRPVSSWAHPCVVQGFSVASTADFSYIFTLLDNHDVLCLTISKDEHIKSTGVGQSARIQRTVVPTVPVLPPSPVGSLIDRTRTQRSRTRSEVRISSGSVSHNAESSGRSSGSAEAQNHSAAEPADGTLMDSLLSAIHDDADPLSFSAPERDRGLLAAIVAREEAEDASELLISAAPSAHPEDSDEPAPVGAVPSSQRMLRASKKSVSYVSLLSQTGRSRALGGSGGQLPRPLLPNSNSWRKGSALPDALKNLKPDPPM